MTPINQSHLRTTKAANGRRARTAVALLALLLLAGTWMPGDLKAGIESRLWGALPWSTLAHFFLFGAIAAVPAYGSGWRAVAWPLALAVALAFLSEAVQQWVPGRHPLLRDGLVDMAGAILGLALSCALRAVATRVRRGEPKRHTVR